MLDSATKKRIDDLRQILVGKLSTPQSQVEQITTGLIYKFMYDMDVEAVKMDWGAAFFVGEYEQYSWEHLFDPKLGGADRVQLYSEAIEKMYNNPNAPTLFREIFKNSSLPFKDPATLNMFLKGIDEFHYTDSEILGDAYEYLLSYMGAQGDSGQFRTPRHIIDFIVEIVNPQKNETILDPACGTAGFLISSYKHILAQNADKKLNATEQKKLGENLVGYELDPTFIKISLVNLHLHKFANPKIHEYDTLSSEDKWNEYYDVILANPPFFSPKGGIQPHSRFGVQSTRAEVLFVDYIMQHLTPNGRAGIIVPEGIIFQAGIAYKKLRKKLVESCLVGVISLPQGVFNPYSAVKTSILILDKKLNKKSDSIFFAKIDNDGFTLGAQRTKIDKNDLPKAIQNFNEWTNTSTQESYAVTKSKILESGDCNLSLGKYLDKQILVSDYPISTIKEVCKITTGRKDVNSGNQNGIYPFFTCAKEHTFSDEFSFDTEALLIAGNGEVGRIIYYKGKFEAYQRTYVLDSFSKILPRYLFFILQTRLPVELDKLKQGNTMPYIKVGMLLDFEIPLPPIEIQQQIVDELEAYQKIIDGCRQVIENYKPTIDIDPSWEMVELGKVVQLNPQKSEIQDLDNEALVSFVPMEDLNENQIGFNPSKSKPLEKVYSNYTYFRDNDILLAKVTPCFENGKAGIARNLTSGIGFGSSEFYVLRCRENILPEWVYINVVTHSFRQQGIANFTGTSGLQRVPKSFVEQYKIPVPDVETQKKLIAKTKQEISIIDGNKKLMEIYTKKIQDRISKVWGE